jgi:hypothetical protein
MMTEQQSRHRSGPSSCSVPPGLSSVPVIASPTHLLGQLGQPRSLVAELRCHVLQVYKPVTETKQCSHSADANTFGQTQCLAPSTLDHQCSR